MYQHGLFVHPTLRCRSFPGHTLYSLGALFLLQPHPSGTLYLLTLDCARAFPHSSATWKLIFSDSLSPPVLQAPLYLRTSRLYTNVLLLLLLLLLWYFAAEKSWSINCTVVCSYQQSCGKMKKSTQRHQQQQLRSKYLLELARGHLGRTCFGRQHVLMVHTSDIQVFDVALLTFCILYTVVVEILPVLNAAMQHLCSCRLSHRHITT